MTTATDSLSRAISYLGAVEVAPGRYAFLDAGRYWIATDTQLPHVYQGNGEGGFKTASELVREGAFIPMPSWWTLEKRFAYFTEDERVATGASAAEVREGARLAYYPHREPERADYVLTADLETGAEVPA